MIWNDFIQPFSDTKYPTAIHTDTQCEFRIGRYVYGFVYHIALIRTFYISFLTTQ